MDGGLVGPLGEDSLAASPLSEDLIAHDSTQEPLMIKAKNLTYTQCGLMNLGKRVD